MKKYLSLILVLITVFLAGCNAFYDKAEINTEAEAQHSYSEALEENNSDVIDQFVVDIPLPTFSNVSEYEKFISETDLPEDFVYYEDIKELGIFSGLVILSDVQTDGYSYYLYSFCPSEKYNDFMKDSFSLYINRKPWSKEYDSKYPLLTVEDVDTANLMILSSEKNARYRYEGLEYWYLNGNLQSIKWQSGDWYYTLSFSRKFRESIDLYNDTNIVKLFKAETATALISSVAPPDKVE